MKHTAEGITQPSLTIEFELYMLHETDNFKD